MSPLKQLLHYAQPEKPAIVKSGIFTFLNKIFDVMPEILIGAVVDVVVRGDESFLASLGIRDPWQQIVALGAITFLIWAAESLTEYVYQVGWRQVAQSLQHRMRLETYQHTQKVTLAELERDRQGRLMTILNDDINQVERFVNDGAANLIHMVSSVLLVGSVFFALSPRIAVFAILPIPVIIFGAFYFQKQISPRYSLVREKAGVIASRLANNLLGIMTIKAFASEVHESKQIESASLDYLNANRAAIAWSAAFTPVIRIGVLSGFLVTLVYGGHLTLQSDISVAAYSVLIFLTQRMLWPLTRLATTVDDFERAMASVRRVMSIFALATEAQIKSREAREARNENPLAECELRFHNVSFTYPDQVEPALKNLNLCVTPGSEVAIVGRSGSGKSSLIKLVERFYYPDSGEIFCGDQRISEMDLTTWRRQIGFVSQDVFLSDDTILENIRYGRPDASLEDVRRAAQAAKIDTFIMSLPLGYNTPVGERGMRLSGGQRQRLSIARALLIKPALLLLDEATSAIDSETERLLQESISQLKGTCTLIVVAHRLSTIRHADSICVLDNGILKEQGTHEELIVQNGIYTDLWNVQTGEVGRPI
jgi:ATP-binding cassette subfamily B protein